MVSLDEVPEGAKAVVVDVAGWGHGLRKRLLEMGLVPGTTVEVLRNNRGPLIVKVRGATVALGRGLAKKVIVKVSSDANA